MHNLHMHARKPRTSTVYLLVITAYFVFIVGLLLGLQSEAHATKWMGWQTWCATHPVKAQHMAVCRGLRP